MTVTAQKPLVKAEIDKLTYSLEDDPEAQTNNTLDMLRKVPMVTVDGDDQIQLKGSTNFKIYMNGKPSNLLSNNPAEVLKSMPANSVKNIEVITDPALSMTLRVSVVLLISLQRKMLYKDILVRFV